MNKPITSVLEITNK